MKSYIIRIELEESNPLIWRRVIMPAGATYRRLHDVIQNVTNFQSGYPGGGYHLYEFDLPKENRIVTDNEEAYMEHQHYIENKQYYEDRLKSMPVNMLQFEKNHQERLKIEVQKPTVLKIDGYLEKFKEIRYNYDFGDDWWFTIKLEEIVDEYYFGYPTLLDGAEIAPPEDVGGIGGFYEFLEAYRDPKHPEHGDMKAWVEDWNFREYDPDWINERLKGLSLDIQKGALMEPSMIPKIDAIDRVIHKSDAMSSGTVGAVLRPWQMHPHQEDNLFVLHGKRHVELYRPGHDKIERFVITPDYIEHNGERIVDGGGLITWNVKLCDKIENIDITQII